MATSFFLPDLGEGLAEADIVKWYVKEGDFVYEDDPLLSVETAKALVDVPAPVTGKVLKIHVQGDTTVPTHSLLAEFEIASSPSSPSPQQESQTHQPSDSSALQDDDAIEAAFQETRTDTATVVGKMVTTTRFLNLATGIRRCLLQRNVRSPFHRETNLWRRSA